MQILGLEASGCVLVWLLLLTSECHWVDGTGCFKKRGVRFHYFAPLYCSCFGVIMLKALLFSCIPLWSPTAGSQRALIGSPQAALVNRCLTSSGGLHF